MLNFGILYVGFQDVVRGSGKLSCEFIESIEFKCDMEKGGDLFFVKLCK